VNIYLPLSRLNYTAIIALLGRSGFDVQLSPKHAATSPKIFDNFNVKEAINA